jgi:hypothetical protein
MHHVVAFVNDEGNNLTSMAISLHSIVYCQPLKLQQIYEGFCFGHVMSKACQYATNHDKVLGLKLVSVKNVQICLQKIITWTKISRKGRLE